MYPTGSSDNHMQFFLNKLKNEEPFAIIRPNDGEYMILKGLHFHTQDKWRFGGGTLSKDLFNSIQLASKLPDLFIGIPCYVCWNNGDTQWYIDTFNLTEKNLTYGNIVCNGNWWLFMDFFIKSKTPFYYIGPGTKQSDKLNIIDRCHIDELQVERWDSEKEIFMAVIETWVDKKIRSNESILFMFSAGPLSKILIPHLFQKYPNHQFIDCGSALDPFLKGNKTRPYLDKNHPYSKLICDYEGKCHRQMSSIPDIHF